MTDDFIVLYALRHAITTQNLEFPQTAAYINDNIAEISGNILKEMLAELSDYYKERTEDKNYLLAKILATQIKREISGGD